MLGAGAKSSIESSTIHGYNPLLIASANGRTEIMIILLNEGANVNGADQSGQGPLHKAMDTDCAKTISVLLQHGANIN